ncbi:MAG: phage capsid protein [Clostridiales Family XIII bacterium]|nr:phage capsid protein [Clostridiales Family XIII bacterium]
MLMPRHTIERVVGQSALSDAMLERMGLWEAMLAGTAPWTDPDKVVSLRLESGIVQDFADVCLSEMEGGVSDAELDEAFQLAVRGLGSELQDGLALGSMAIKPLGYAPGVDYVTPDRLIPVRFDGWRLVDVVFLDRRPAPQAGQHFVRCERHTLDGEVLTITNRAFRAQEGTAELLGEVPLDSVPDWARIAPEASFSGVERPVFGYFRTPLKNRVDGSQLSVSVYDSAAALIQDADEQYGRLVWEMQGGELAVHVDPSAMRYSDRQDRLSDRLYKMLDVEQGEHKGLYSVFSPVLRDESLLNGLNAILRRIEYAVGLSYGDLSDVQEVAKTATEIAMSKARKFQTVKAIERNLRDCLDDLVYAFAFWRRKATSGYEFVCEFADSILTDDESVNAGMREDVAAGIIRPEKYIAKKYGVDEETAAREWMPQQQAAD